MLFEKRTQRREEKSEAAIEDPSIFPLAMPLIAGPGAMATMILLAGQPDLEIPTLIGIYAVMALVITIVFTLFLGAGLMERILGETGIMVVTRPFGHVAGRALGAICPRRLRDLGVLG